MKLKTCIIQAIATVAGVGFASMAFVVWNTERPVVLRAFGASAAHTGCRTAISVIDRHHIPGQQILVEDALVLGVDLTGDTVTVLLRPEEVARVSQFKGRLILTYGQSPSILDYLRAKFYGFLD